MAEAASASGSSGAGSVGPAATGLLPTEFAPAERMPSEVIQRQAALIAGAKLIPTLLNSVLNVVVILNAQRQIVFASENIRTLVKKSDTACLLGLRPGEAFGCVHAVDAPDGCGTTLFCGQCGAVRAILSSLHGRPDVQECQITRQVDRGLEALDLRVYGTPFTYQGEPFAIFAIADISHEKRRRVLERIFFHDILNYAGGLEGLVAMVNDRIPEELRGEMNLVATSLTGLMDEILSQRDLTSAERNELTPDFRPLTSRDLLEDLVRLYQQHPAADGRELRLAPDSPNLAFSSDNTLLRRVLGNLIKNALEAVRTGQTVTIGVTEAGNALRFGVHNPGVIPPEVRLQIFNRSFSTKGSDQGLGTYSVRLLTERFLGGQVAFTSDAETGTCFTVTLPKKPAPVGTRTPIAGTGAPFAGTRPPFAN